MIPPLLGIGTGSKPQAVTSPRPKEARNGHSGSAAAPILTLQSVVVLLDAAAHGRVRRNRGLLAQAIAAVPLRNGY
jgi:hypothetical protein